MAFGMPLALLSPMTYAETTTPRGIQTVPPTYKRPSAAIEERVADLLARMNLDDKIAQLRGGMKALTRPVEELDALQQKAINDARLGIPILFYDMGVQAKAAGPAPFPGTLALASSWDPALVEEIGALEAADLRSRGGRMAFSPLLDVTRDPRRGYIERTFGEDPHLVGILGVAAVTGRQGPASKAALPPGKVLAAVGHLAGHGLAEDGAAAGTLPTAQRELREVFFPPFEAVLKHAEPAAVIVSRNELDGVPSHASSWLLRDVLRGEWKFSGAVLGDRGGVGELQSVHGVATNLAAAGQLALEAGVDADLPDGSAFQTLAPAVRMGRIATARLDAAVGRLLALKFRAGLFEQPYADADARSTVRDYVRLQAAALKAAQRSIVLLKNDGALPFASTGVGGGKPKVVVIESGPPGASVADGLRTRVRDRAEVIAGGNIKHDGSADAAIVASTKAAAPDYVVLAIGGEAQPRTGDLLEALRALGKPVVVVLNGDRPSADPRIASQANALVGAWGLGAQGGKAAADVLLGDVNPGGKLPVTLARSGGQLPITYDAKPSARRGYLFESSEPLYAFGWGLGYSTFELGAPRLSRAILQASQASDAVEVSVDVRNTGTRGGDETIQLYVRGKVSAVTRPVKLLKGFQRVALAPGERRTVTFRLDAGGFESWDEQMRRTVEPGEFDIMTGSNSTQLQSIVLTVTARPQP